MAVFTIGRKIDGIAVMFKGVFELIAEGRFIFND
jgi:hypothetical protein